MSDPGGLMAVAAGLMLLGVLASKVSDRLGVPALLLFLVIGMLAGSEGVGGIDFDDHELAQDIGVVALAFILFAGGLDTRWRAVRPVLVTGLLLATIGVMVTALVVGAVASLVLDVSLTAGLLLGAIVSSTDAAAVFSVLRSSSVSLKGQLRPLLELESGSNDPMAVFLTLAFLRLLTEPDTAIVELLPLFVAQMAIGTVVGWAVARGAVAAINTIRLTYEGLYPVALIALVLLTYGAAAVLGGSGFLAVYVAGIVMGRRRFLHQKSLMRFADGLAWLMQITMFLTLGLLVFPSRLGPVAGEALLLSAVLILVARPVATALVLVLRRFSARETTLVSWVGLRGAVPIVLATFPLVEGIPQSDLLFHLVFFIVLTSVVVQGTTIPAFARWLRVEAPLAVARQQPIEFVGSTDGSTDLHELVVASGSGAAGTQLVDLHLPQGTLVVLITREESYVVPTGSTVLLPDDVLMVLAEETSLDDVRALIEGTAG